MPGPEDHLPVDQTKTGQGHTVPVPRIAGKPGKHTTTALYYISDINTVCNVNVSISKLTQYCKLRTGLVYINLIFGLSYVRTNTF